MIRMHSKTAQLPYQTGFSLLELMVAMVLGLLLSVGIMTLFSGTSQTNRIQDGLARLQENGRYAVTRMEADLRALSGQYCTNFSGNSTQNANGFQIPARAPLVYAGTVPLFDKAPVAAQPSAFALSPRVFVQGYDCHTGTCSPAIPTSGPAVTSPATAVIPAVGTADGTRLKGTDVLTIRYQTGSGWPVTTAPNCTSGGNIVLNPQTGDDTIATTPPTFNPADLIVISDCQNPTILPIASIAGNTLKLGSLLPDTNGIGPGCTAGSNRDTRVFNFTQNFVTVTYFVKLVKDPNPDATAGRMIPVLVRRANSVDQELVQGVERLDFKYGVQDANGAVRYLTASQVETQSAVAGVCAPPPAGVALEPGCLWRTLKSVEVHTLMDTVDNLQLAAVDTAYHYSIDDLTGVAPPAPPTAATSPVTGLPFGKMMRREFISLVDVRNYNP